MSSIKKPKKEVLRSLGYDPLPGGVSSIASPRRFDCATWKPSSPNDLILTGSASGDGAMKIDKEGPAAYNMAAVGEKVNDELWEDENLSWDHKIRSELVLGAPETLHASAQRLLWEALWSGDIQAARGALVAGADPQEPSWMKIDGGPALWLTPLCWTLDVQTGCGDSGFRRDMFDLLWEAGGRVDPQPQSGSSELSSTWALSCSSMKADDARHVAQCLSRGKAPRGGGGPILGLLETRNAEGNTAVDVAFGCGGIEALRILEELVIEQGRTLEELFDHSLCHDTPAPSVLWASYGRGTLASNNRVGVEKISDEDRNAFRDYWRRAATFCTWKKWCTVLPQHTTPLFETMRIIGAGETLAIARQSDGFSWSSGAVFTPSMARSLHRWRRTILRLNRSRRELGVHKAGEFSAFFNKHPTLQSFQPWTRWSMKRMVQEWCLDNHPYARSGDKCLICKIERAKLRIALGDEAPPSNRTGRRRGQRRL